MYKVQELLGSIIFICLCFLSCSQNDLKVTCEDVESLSVSKYGRFSAEEHSYRPFIGTSEYGRSRVEDTSSVGWTHSDSLIFLHGYEVNSNCRITSSIEFNHIARNGDTQYLFNHNNMVNNLSKTVQFFVTDDDVVFTEYSLYNSRGKNNWVMISMEDPSTGIIEGIFELHLIKETGFLNTPDWPDTLHLVNGHFTSIYNSQ